jgi:hypothetical protein
MNDEARDELLQKIERLEALINHPVRRNNTPIFSSLLNKLKEQGTQRGILMLVGSSFPLIGWGLEVQDTIAIMSAIFAIIGMNNIMTEG